MYRVTCTALSGTAWDAILPATTVRIAVFKTVVLPLPAALPSCRCLPLKPNKPVGLQACHWAIDELKAAVPIWKKEIFQGGEVWKENEEWRQQQAAARLAERGTAAAGAEDAAQHFACSAQPGAR
jgi:hypothetical protein